MHANSTLTACGVYLLRRADGVLGLFRRRADVWRDGARAQNAPKMVRRARHNTGEDDWAAPKRHSAGGTVLVHTTTKRWRVLSPPRRRPPPPAAAHILPSPPVAACCCSLPPAAARCRPLPPYPSSQRCMSHHIWRRTQTNRARRAQQLHGKRSALDAKRHSCGCEASQLDAKRHSCGCEAPQLRMRSATAGCKSATRLRIPGVSRVEPLAVTSEGDELTAEDRPWWCMVENSLSTLALGGAESPPRPSGPIGYPLT